MFDPKAEKICGMIQDLAKKHEGQIYSLQLDWTILEISSPRYSSKIQQPVPLLDIQFK